MPAGRPKKTLKDLPEDWRYKMEALSKVGASEVELRVELGISQSTFKRFRQDYPEFSRTVKKCIDLCRAWWEKQGRTELTNKTFQTALWYINMKNRFGWRDVPPDISENATQTATRIQESLRKMDAVTRGFNGGVGSNKGG